MMAGGLAGLGAPAGPTHPGAMGHESLTIKLSNSLIVDDLPIDRNCHYLFGKDLEIAPDPLRPQTRHFPRFSMGFRRSHFGIL